MTISILFRPKNRVRAKIFRTFRETFSIFSPSRKCFRRPNFFFSKFSWQRCDSFGPKIVKIGAILTVFRPFEISRKFVPYKLLQNFLCGYKIEMAILHTHICVNMLSNDTLLTMCSIHVNWQCRAVLKNSGTKKAPKLNCWGKFCRQKSLLKFWPMGGQKKV